MDTITLQYWQGIEWVNVGKFSSDWAAWVSLGGDDMNYRTVDSEGVILTDKSNK